MKTYQPEIETFSLIPSDRGRFELEVNGELIYSKAATGRHIQEGEATELLREYLGK